LRSLPILLLAAFILSPTALVCGQEENEISSSATGETALLAEEGTLPDKPEPVQGGTAGEGNLASSSVINPGDHPASQSEQQPKRILGMMPNFRAVSPGDMPPPPTPRESLWIATQNSFDYSSFVFVGLTSLYAEGTNAHEQLGKGVAGYGRYYWRGFIDKTTGNYLVLFALPTAFHQDERYYAKGEGGFLKRLAYSSTRILITPNYQGKNGINYSELLGRSIADGISAAYYPSEARTPSAVATRIGYALLRDAAMNVFREFWPDISTHVLHRHP